MLRQIVFQLNRRAGLWLGGLTFLVRIFVILKIHESPYSLHDQGDMRFYNTWALNILQGQWTDHYAFYGLPGYAFLLAGLYKILGFHPSFVICLQAILEAFISLMIYNLAKMIGDRASWGSSSQVAGALAALGYAFFVPAQAFSSILMPTCLLVTAFWAAVWWSARTRSSRVSGWEALGLGTGVGMVAMVVATIFFVLPLFAAKLARRGEKRLAALFLLLVGVLLGCSPAILHNRLVAHDTVALSAHGGLNFFIGNHAGASGYLQIPEGLRANQAQMLTDSITVAERAIGGTSGRKIPRSAVSAYWSDQAKAYIQEHPGRWIGLLGQKVINFWNAYQYDDLSVIRAFAEQGVTTPGWYFGFVAAVGLAGLVSIWRMAKARWIVAAVLLYLGSLLTVFITERYRLAAVPGLLILAALFIVQWWKDAAAADWKCVAKKTAALGATMLFVTMTVPNQGAWALDTYNSGIRFLAAQDLPKAREQLQLAWRYSPENDQTNLAIANLYLAENDLPKAQAFYRRSLRLNPKNTAALNNLGYIALTQKQPAAAIGYFSQALTIDSGNRIAIYQLATAYWRNNEAAKGLAILQEALRQQPGQKDWLELQAQIVSEHPPSLP